MLTKVERAQSIKFQDAIGEIVDQYLKEGMHVDMIVEVLLDEAGSDLDKRRGELAASISPNLGKRQLMPKFGNKPQHEIWIRDHLDYPHKDCCLIWPFLARNNGYGTFVKDGKKYYVHRVICEKIHGVAPSPSHQAAHSCNRGHEGCVNPHHLRWKTRSENQKEAPPRRRFKLTIEIATEIRSLKGIETARVIASRFGIRESTVRDIQAGRIWKIGGQRRHPRVIPLALTN